MSDGFSWSATRDSGAAYRLPGPDHLGWWAAVAMLVSILLHVIVFFMLDQMKIALKFEEAKELATRPIDVRQVEISPAQDERSLPPEEVVMPPADTKSLLEDIELLAKLPENAEIDIKPEIVEAQYALKMENPAIAGDPAAVAMELSSNLEIDTADLPELGRQPESIRPAEVGQLTVDPGAVTADDTEAGGSADLIKYGANGKTDHGTLDGVTSLENMLDLPPNLLLGSKTMLPSDLLFEFNSSELRENAKVGLMKLGLLMDRNPNLYCWIEGHTDLVDALRRQPPVQLTTRHDAADGRLTWLYLGSNADGSEAHLFGGGPHRCPGAAFGGEVVRSLEAWCRKEPDREICVRVEKWSSSAMFLRPESGTISIQPLRRPR